MTDSAAANFWTPKVAWEEKPDGTLYIWQEDPLPPPKPRGKRPLAGGVEQAFGVQAALQELETPTQRPFP